MSAVDTRLFQWARDITPERMDQLKITVRPVIRFAPDDVCSYVIWLPGEGETLIVETSLAEDPTFELIRWIEKDIAYVTGGET